MAYRHNRAPLNMRNATMEAGREMISSAIHNLKARRYFSSFQVLQLTEKLFAKVDKKIDKKTQGLQAHNDALTIQVASQAKVIRVLFRKLARSHMDRKAKKPGEQLAITDGLLAITDGLTRSSTAQKRKALTHGLPHTLALTNGEEAIGTGKRRRVEMLTETGQMPTNGARPDAKKKVKNHTIKSSTKVKATTSKHWIQFVGYGNVGSHQFGSISDE